MEKESEQRGKVIFERTEAAQCTECTATADAENTGTSNTGRVELAAGSAVWTVQPASCVKVVTRYS